MRYGKFPIRLNGKLYKQISITRANKLYNENKTIYLCGNKSNIFSCWINLCPVNFYDFGNNFKDNVNSFLYYLDSTLGSYANYFIEIED